MEKAPRRRLLVRSFKCARQRTGIEVDCVQLSVLRNIKDPKAAELTYGLGIKKEMTQET